MAGDEQIFDLIAEENFVSDQVKSKIKSMENLLQDAQKVIKDSSKLESYGVNSEVLSFLIGKYPDNKVLSIVSTKVKILNLLYSTSLRATNKMAEHIVELNIDERLKKGDLTLIPEIATLKLSDSERFNYSFATKYCASHQPTLFPIYDSIVAEVFCTLMAKGNLPPFVNSERTKSKDEFSMSRRQFAGKLKDYSFYCNVYNTFMQDYSLTSLTFRQVDNYLWSAYKLGGETYRIEEIAHINENKYQKYDR